MVLFQADVPGQAADCGHRLELVDDVPRDEVNVVVTELRTDVANPFPPQLIQLGIIHPLNTLQKNTHLNILVEQQTPASFRSKT